MGLFLPCNFVKPVASPQGKLAVAENILKLAELARKYETEQEKVLPFWAPGEAVPAPGTGGMGTAASQQGQEEEGQQQEGEGEVVTSVDQEPSAAQLGELGLRPEGEGEEGEVVVAGGGKGAVGVGGAGGGAGGAGKGGKPKYSSYGLDPASGAEVGEWDYLNRFFKRYNKVGWKGGSGGKGGMGVECTWWYGCVARAGTREMAPVTHRGVGCGQ